MTIKPDRFYLRAQMAVSNSWDRYEVGELIRNGKDRPRTFLKLERAIAAIREYGWPDRALEVRRGDTL